MQLLMDQCKIGVGDHVSGGKQIVIADVRSGITVVVPLDGDACRQIAAALGSGIVVANGPLVIPGNGGPH